MPERQQKKSHDRRLVALATHHVFKLFNLKYDLFNFHYGYQQSLMNMLYQKLTEVSTYLLQSLLIIGKIMNDTIYLLSK